MQKSIHQINTDLADRTLRALNQKVVESALYKQLTDSKERTLEARDYVLIAAASLGGVTDETLTTVSSGVIVFKQIISELGYGDAFVTLEALDEAVNLAKEALKSAPLERALILFGNIERYIVVMRNITKMNPAEGVALCGSLNAGVFAGTGGKWIDPSKNGSVEPEVPSRKFRIDSEILGYLTKTKGEEEVATFISAMNNKPDFITALDILHDLEAVEKVFRNGYVYEEVGAARNAEALARFECMCKYHGSVETQLAKLSYAPEWDCTCEPFPNFCARMIALAVSCFVNTYAPLLEEVMWYRLEQQRVKEAPIDAASELVTKVVNAVTSDICTERQNIYKYGMKDRFLDTPYSLPFAPQRLHRAGYTRFDEIMVPTISFLRSMNTEAVYDHLQVEHALLNPFGRFKVRDEGNIIAVESNGTPSAKVLLTKIYSTADAAVFMLPYVLNLNGEITSEKPRYKVTLNGLLPSYKRFARADATLIVVLDTLTGNVYTDHSLSTETSMSQLYNGDELIFTIVFHHHWNNFD